MFAVPLSPDAHLRPLDPWRAPEFLSHLDRAREHIAPWVGQSFLATDLASARAVLQRYADSHARDSGGLYGIWLDDVLVGGVMFVSLDAASGACELGCWLEPRAVGRGLVTRSVEHLIDWAVRVRGIQRVEWQTLSGNDSSVRVAQRLGMRRDGILRDAVPPRGDVSTRQDLEIWSVLAAEWLARPARPDPDKLAIDQLASTFFAAFTTVNGQPPAVESIYDLFVAEGRIFKGGPEQTCYDVGEFVRPRLTLLTTGELTEFHEEETGAQTEIAGDLAQRFSRYRKSGILSGAPFEGRGSKSFQFLRTPAGWRITSLTWIDEA